MKLIIDIDDNVFTRLFDNGVDTSLEDRKVIDRAVRNGKPYEERPKGDELIKRAVLIICRNVRPDGDMGYFDWEDRCMLQDIYHELIKEG